MFLLDMADMEIIAGLDLPNCVTDGFSLFKQLYNRSAGHVSILFQLYVA